jgi:UDP-N-acetylglucosamine 2-epimerase (non-hydrolysing)
MKKILVVFGTRPEAIKLIPVIRELKKKADLKVTVCVFRQHKEMLDQILKPLGVEPDIDLKISINDKDLFYRGAGFFTRIKTLIQSGLGFLRFIFILRQDKPDLLIVQGDTSTVFLAAFFAYHFKISVAHVEAGLRTYDKYAPFPEEMNRQLLCRLADFNFAPTEIARKNLLSESILPDRILVTGNTAIDALLQVSKRHEEPSVAKRWLEFFKKKYGLDLEADRKIILVTAHRRESFGEGLKNIFSAIKEIAERRRDVLLVYPVHLNPNVRELARSILQGHPNILLIEPVEYEPFIFLMKSAHFILTDSGGIQEEAPSLNKPVLVMREKTERMEGVEIGASKLVGTDEKKIIAATLELLDDPKAYASMTGKKNPYGDGNASVRIAEALVDYLK